VPTKPLITKRGGQKGNRNALKTGRYTADKVAARRQCAAVIKVARVAVAEVYKSLPKAKPGPKPGSRRAKQSACGNGAAASKRDGVHIPPDRERSPPG